MARIDPGWLAANIAIEGTGPITQLPPGTIIRVPSGASIFVSELNSPCRVAARLLAQHGGYAGDDATFVRHAQGRRGVVGFVYAAGRVEVGDHVQLLFAKRQPATD
jgi:MOSC domain-containing protein YiiM